MFRNLSILFISLIMGCTIPQIEGNSSSKLTIKGVFNPGRSLEDKSVAYLVLYNVDNQDVETINEISDSSFSLSVKRGKSYLLLLTDSSYGYIGNIYLANSSLDAIPINSDVGDSSTLDLGSLTFDSTRSSFVSQVLINNIESALNIPENTLKEYGKVDQTLLKATNLDINGNGVIDYREDIRWAFSVLQYFYFNQDLEFDFNSGTITTPVEDFRPRFFSYLFTTHSGFSHPPKESVTLNYPKDLILTTTKGNTVSSITSNWSQPQGYYFYLRNDSPEDDNVIESPLPPFKGDYEVFIENNVYKIDNVDFLNFNNSLEGDGYIFPIAEVVIEDGIYSIINWKWKVLSNNQFLEPESEVIGMNLKSLTFMFEKRVHQGEGGTNAIGIEIDDYTLSGSIDIRGYDLKVSEVRNFFANTVDLADNLNMHMIFYNE